jgi:hypothetical protein
LAILGERVTVGSFPPQGLAGRSVQNYRQPSKEDQHEGTKTQRHKEKILENK